MAGFGKYVILKHHHRILGCDKKDEGHRSGPVHPLIIETKTCASPG